MTIKRVYDGLAVFLAFALGWLAITATAQAETIETITYYHNDLTGSPVAATDEQGNVIWRKEYSPYGEELNQEQQPDHRGFTGHVHDADLGLTYMQARYYDPILGRFLAVDPAAVNPEVPFSFNRYAYANNNPYKFMDPDGRVPILIPVVIFIGKEIAFEVIERQVGFTPPSLKNGGKYLLKKGFSEGAKKTFKESTNVTKRPGSFRKKTVEDSWDNAADGKKPDTKSCPTCRKDVSGNPHKGEKRNHSDGWDVDHQPPWSQRDLSGMNRKLGRLRRRLLPSANG